MGFIAERVHAIKPSPTLQIIAKSNELKAAGKDLISLGAGEPDYDTPDFVKEGAYKAIREGQTKYTAVDGTPALKKAVIEKFKRENHVDYAMDEVMISNGGKQVIYNALLATLNAGDEVIIPAPYWVSYPDMVVLCEGKPVVVECSEAQNFILSPEQLQAAITPKTKWVIINSPSNPTGAAYTKEKLEAIADVLRQHPHVYAMSDDIYEHLIYDGGQFYTLAQVAPDLKGRILTINGVSKSHSMTGWRIGYAGGPKELIKAMAKLQSQSTSNPCSISQAAALTALTGDQGFLAEWRASYSQRRDTVARHMNAIDGLSCRIPEGAFYVYVNCRDILGRKTPQGKTLGTDSDVAEYLLEAALVSVVPGSAFGLAPYFRISYATSPALLEKACARIAEAVGKLTV